MVRVKNLVWGLLLIPVLGLGAEDWPADWLRPHAGTNGGGYSQNERARLEWLAPWRVVPSRHEAARIIDVMIPSSLFPVDVVWLSRRIGSPLRRAQRETLWKRVRRMQMDESGVSVYSNAVFGNKAEPYHIMPAEPLGWYDFNSDGKSDLLLVTKGYFGPSYGYGAFALGTKPAREIVDISSGLAAVTRAGTRTILRFDVMKIDPAEAQIEYFIIADNRTGRISYGPCLAYASETVMPQSWLGRSRVLRAPTLRIRKGPVVDNTAVNPDEAWKLEGTSVLAGNIVAELRPGSMLWVLAEQPGWVFVSAPPLSVLKTSLRHGMDEEGEKKTPRVPYTVCGWLKLAP